MASSYSNELRLELQANGENATTWGTKTNNNLGFIEDAISGMGTISMSDGTNTLSTANGATDEARMSILKLTGALTASATVDAPAKSKHYIVWNATTGNQTVTVQVTGGGGTGVVIPQGKTMFVFTDGTDFYHSDTTTDSLLVVTGILPDADDGAYLGQAGTAFSDLFLASGGVINWDSGDITLTHTANNLTFAGGTLVVSTIDVNGGAIDGATIGAAAASTVVATTITANTGIVPDADDGAYLGQSGTAFSDLFLASGAVINFNAADITLTHSANDLAVGGGTLTIDTGLMPDANDGAYLGQSGTAFSDLFLASGAVINFNAGDVTITHGSNLLTIAGGDVDVEGLDVSNELTLSGLISPAQITTDQNDYAPSGIGTAYTVRVDASTQVNITGLSASQAEGREICIENDGTTNAIILNDENASSTAANRFALPNGADVTIAPEASVTLRYDGTASRWRIKGAAAGGGAVGGGSDQIMFANDQTSSGSGAGDYTLAATKNAVTAGTFTIASGDTITVSSGARWVIV